MPECGGAATFGDGGKARAVDVKQVSLHLVDVDLETDTAVFKASHSELQKAFPMMKYDTLYIDVEGPTADSTMLHPKSRVNLRVGRKAE